jgi:hypothetical protein
MEYADGGDLSAAVKKRKSERSQYSEIEAMRIFVQCCHALRRVHAQHVMHRDLKSQNIFLTKTGAVKLGDFGIAKVLEHTKAEAQTMIGTPLFLAPEVCENDRYTLKADIWSLGVVFYELLALDLPFRGENLPVLIMKIVNSEPRPLSDCYSPQLRTLIAALLEKRPAKRPTIDEIIAQLVLLQDLPACGARLPLLKSSNGEDEATLLPGTSREREHCPLPKAPRPCSSQLPRRNENSRVPKMSPRPASQPTGGNKVDIIREPATTSNSQRDCEPEAPSSNARADGTRRHPLRSQSAEPPGVHLQALQQAAAQSRRDGQMVMQKMRELEGKQIQQKLKELQQVDSEACKGNVTSAQEDQAQHLKALQAASADARRERMALRRRHGEAIHGSPNAINYVSDDVRGCSIDDVPDIASRRLMSKRCAEEAEAQHLQALNAASAEARRERLALRERYKDSARGSADVNDFMNDDIRESRGSLVDGGADIESRRAASKRCAEEAEAQHLKALRAASAEAWRERLALRDRYNDAVRGSADVNDFVNDDIRESRGSLVDSGADIESRRAASKRCAEEAEAQHLKLLRAASAEARRERLALRERYEDAVRNSTDTENSVNDDNGGSLATRLADIKSRRAACAQEAEARHQHLKALRDASAEARRERLALREKHEDAVRTPRGAEGAADDELRRSSFNNKTLLRGGSLEMTAARVRPPRSPLLALAGGALATSSSSFNEAAVPSAQPTVESKVNHSYQPLRDISTGCEEWHTSCGRESVLDELTRGSLTYSNTFSDGLPTMPTIIVS